MSILLSVLVIVVIAVVAFIIVDKGFTGPMAEFAWIAKFIICIIALITLYYLVGVHNLSLK